LEVKLVQKLFQCSPVVLFKLWYQSYTIESRCFLLQIDPYKFNPVIRPICITILYRNLLLFIDIFHI
jgi:hypothetical protein